MSSSHLGRLVDSMFDLDSNTASGLRFLHNLKSTSECAGNTIGIPLYSSVTYLHGLMVDFERCSMGYRVRQACDEMLERLTFALVGSPPYLSQHILAFRHAMNPQ